MAASNKILGAQEPFPIVLTYVKIRSASATLTKQLVEYSRYREYFYHDTGRGVSFNQIKLEEIFQ